MHERDDGAPPPAGEESERLDARLLEVWAPAPPPAGFVDRALARMEAEPARRSPWRRWAVGLGLCAAAAAALLLMAGRRPAQGAGEERAQRRVSVPLTAAAVAVMEPRAHLRWSAERGRVRVAQDAGEIFYRVDRGTSFEVRTPAATIEVTGTCFKVEVNDMSPVTQTLMAGAVGAALGAAVVSVYEGQVKVRNPAGEVVLAPGQRALAGGAGAPRLVPTSAPGAAVPRLSSQALAALSADTRATVTALEEKVASLTTALAEARREAVEGPRDRDGIPKNKFHDFSPDELAVLARRCEIRYDVPAYFQGAPPEVPQAVATQMGLDEPGRARLNHALKEIAPPQLEKLRALYTEGTGDQAGAQKLSPRDLQHALFERFPREMEAARKRLAQERAGQLAPPADPATGPVVERLLRLIMASSDELERRLGEVVGAERAGQIRRADGLGGRRVQSGCPQ
jgi:hypothetical protein